MWTLQRAPGHGRRRTAEAGRALVTLLVLVGLCSGCSAGNGDSAPTPSEHPFPPETSPTAPGASTSTALNGTWIVHVLLDTDGHSGLSAADANKVRLTFYDTHPGLSGAGHHNLIGDTGCNSISGTYRQSGNEGRHLVFARHLVSTLVGCRNEPPLLARLLDVRHISGSGDTRYLRDADGTVVVELRRASAKMPSVKPAHRPARPTWTVTAPSLRD